MTLLEDIKRYQKTPKMCDERNTCIQHPMVCLICNRRKNVKDCYKKYEG